MDSQYNGEIKKEKKGIKRAEKQYTENERLSNTKPTGGIGCSGIQMIPSCTSGTPRVTTVKNNDFSLYH